MPFFVRSRNNGKTFELRIKHGRLPKPVYFTFDVSASVIREHPAKDACCHSAALSCPSVTGTHAFAQGLCHRNA
jgi:hypothetical protein